MISHGDSSLQITFSMASIMNYGPPPDLANFTVYTIEVIASLPTGLTRSWKVQRRYADFDKFDSELGASFNQQGRSKQSGSYSGHLAALPKLPQKQFWGRFDPNFLQSRAMELQNYLNALCGSPAVHPLDCTRKFMGVDDDIAKRRMANSTDQLSSLSSGLRQDSSHCPTPTQGLSPNNTNYAASKEALAHAEAMEIQAKLAAIVESAQAQMLTVGGYNSSKRSSSRSTSTARMQLPPPPPPELPELDESKRELRLQTWRSGSSWVAKELSREPRSPCGIDELAASSVRELATQLLVVRQLDDVVVSFEGGGGL